MKMMVTLSGPFEGGDPTEGEQRTFTIGEPDAQTLARRVGEWAHDQVLRMTAAPVADEPVTLWDCGEVA